MFVPDKREKDKMERKKKNLDVYRNIAQVWSQKNDIDLFIHESTYAITVLQHAEKIA